jgi:Ohr subfamily peroxiredoxin
VIASSSRTGVQRDYPRPESSPGEEPSVASTTVAYTARVHTTGGRHGASRTDDGRLHVKLSRPGTTRDGTNPEQLFAAGWSACFLSAIRGAARRMKVRLPAALAIDAEVDFCTEDGEQSLRARLNVTMPGLERDVADALVDAAHQTCPYSKATRGNIQVAITVA